MKKAVLLGLVVMALTLVLISAVSARSPYQTEVNTVCGTTYSGCTLCHPNGNTGQLNQTADTYGASGACGICPNDPDCSVTTPTCTDADRDSYDAEGGDCGAIDCNDNNAAVNPGVREICDNNRDDDCDLFIDCNDPNCAGDQACVAVGACTPTARSERKACNDGIDNDCDGAADCDDSDCRRACRPPR